MRLGRPVEIPQHILADSCAILAPLVSRNIDQLGQAHSVVSY